MAKLHERTRARQAALQVLYSGEITENAPSAIVEQGVVLDDDGSLSEYAKSLVAGVDEHRAEIDAKLEASSENWTLSRMPIVDRSILRLAAFEMQYVEDVPLSVSINEAVELAKAFGGEDESFRFVNGVLGKVAQTIEPAFVPEEVAEDEAAEGAVDEAVADEAAEAAPAEAAEDAEALAAQADSVEEPEESSSEE